MFYLAGHTPVKHLVFWIMIYPAGNRQDSNTSKDTGYCFTVQHNDPLLLAATLKLLRSSEKSAESILLRQEGQLSCQSITPAHTNILATLIPAAPLDLLTDYEKLQSITTDPVLPLWLAGPAKSPPGARGADKHRHPCAGCRPATSTCPSVWKSIENLV